MSRTLVVVLVAAVAALAVVIVLVSGGGEDDSGSEPERSSEGPSLEQIARRVERVRELEFERLPRVRRVSEDEIAEVALKQVDAQLPQDVLEGEERVLVSLALLPPDASIRDLLSKALSSEVGGLYVPSESTMYLVEGELSGGALGDILLAHELTHALEDQHFGLETGEMEGLWRDRFTAEGAVQEGTATVAMVDYAVLAQGGGSEVPSDLRGQALEQLDEVAVPASSGLPRYLREGLVWPYAAGGQLVNRVEGQDGWGAVDRLFAADAPVSSEQVMHPGRYEARERPVTVRMGDLSAVLPDGARLAYGADIGEWDTEQFLRDANGRRRSEPGAAGWGGGAFELWELPGDLEDDVLAVRWEWDSERDAREFEAAARRTLERLPRSNVIVRAGKRGVVLAQALDPELARTVARRARKER